MIELGSSFPDVIERYCSDVAGPMHNDCLQTTPRLLSLVWKTGRLGGPLGRRSTRPRLCQEAQAFTVYLSVCRGSVITSSWQLMPSNRLPRVSENIFTASLVSPLATSGNFWAAVVVDLTFPSERSVRWFKPQWQRGEGVTGKLNVAFTRPIMCVCRSWALLSPATSVYPPGPLAPVTGLAFLPVREFQQEIPTTEVVVTSGSQMSTYVRYYYLSVNMCRYKLCTHIVIWVILILIRVTMKTKECQSGGNNRDYVAKF